MNTGSKSDADLPSIEITADSSTISAKSAEAVEPKNDENDEYTYSINTQIGDSSEDYDSMAIKIKSMSSKSLAIDGLEKGGITSIKSAHDAIDTIKTAINTVSTVRGDLGAYQNRLEHTANN